MTAKEIVRKLESMLPDEEWDLGKLRIIKSGNGSCWIYFYSTEMHYTNSLIKLTQLIRKLQKVRGEQ